MSKIDEMRRRREAQHDAQTQRSRAGAGGRAENAAPSPSTSPQPHAPETERAARASNSKTDVVEAACSACGKVRALHNGLVSNHQKGLGKMCPGSRKEPA